MATAPESNKVIYSMTGVTKAHDKKIVLKDIYLSYFYGAKIGVLGLNGSGKSSLLKILAGVDKIYDGQITLQPGYTTDIWSRNRNWTPRRRSGKSCRVGCRQRWIYWLSLSGSMRNLPKRCRMMR